MPQHTVTVVAAPRARNIAAWASRLIVLIIHPAPFIITEYRKSQGRETKNSGTGNGIPDSGVDINDLLHFLLHFEAGC